MKISAGRVRLSPEQQRVVDERARDLQVIACAGSGKTESISRRIARLLAEGVGPAAVVAFTFTERAAAELRERVIRRVEARRRMIDVTLPEARAATTAAVEMIAEIRNRRFKHRAGPKTCASCAYTRLCRHAHSAAGGSSGGTRDPGLRTSTGPKAGRVAGRVGSRLG